MPLRNQVKFILDQLSQRALNTNQAEQQLAALNLPVKSGMLSYFDLVRNFGDGSMSYGDIYTLLGV